MDALFIAIANVVGASVDQVKLIVCLLVAYPLGSVFIRVPSSKPTLRHIFNLSIAIFFLLPVLQLYSGFLQLLADVLATFFIAKHVTGPKMPWIVFFLVLGHLVCNHIIRLIYSLSYETMEITGPQMVLIMKLSTFAWNIHDGRRPANELDAWQSRKVVRTFPSLLEFLGYAFYFPGLLVGPYLDFVDYLDLVHDKSFQGQDVKGKNGRNLPPGRKRVAYRKMVKGLLWLGFFILFGPNYTFSAALRPEFLAKSFWMRFLVFQTYGVVERAKYYALWTLTEGASILTGLGFSGFGPSGASQWDGACNVKELPIELPQNFKGLLDAWNINTNIWLRECIYKRVTPKGKKPGFKSNMLTSLSSAVWHGVYPGYYLMFLMGLFVTTAARLARANFRPLVLPAPGQKPSIAKRIYDILGTVVSTIILNYVASAFMLLSLRDSITVWARLGFYGHFIIFGGLIFFYTGGTKFLKRLQAKQGLKLAANGNASGTSTPVEEKNVLLPPPVDEIFPPPQK